MSGIVFFMLVGHWFQAKTHDPFSFDRNYKSYFLLGVTLLNEGGKEVVSHAAAKTADHILVRHNEMVPAGSIILHGIKFY